MKRGLLFLWLLGFLVTGWSPESAARRKKKRSFLLQILVQTPQRFAVQGVRVYAGNTLLGLTDRYGIFVGFLKGYKGQRVVIKVHGRHVGLYRRVVTRLQTRITDSKIVSDPIKLYFVAKGGEKGKTYHFPIRVIALSPDREGIAQASVSIDGKVVGKTNKFGIWVGVFPGRQGEVIQIQVTGRGADNTVSKSARLRLDAHKRPRQISFQAFLRP